MDGSNGVSGFKFDREDFGGEGPSYLDVLLECYRCKADIPRPTNQAEFDAIEQFALELYGVEDPADLPEVYLKLQRSDFTG